MSETDLVSESTPRTLLEDLILQSGTLGWERFVFLYEPTMHRWLLHCQVHSTDVADIVQETLLVVVRRLPEFQHNGRKGAFRKWLKTILMLQLKNYNRLQSRVRSLPICDEIHPIADPQSDPERYWDAEHDRAILRRLLQLARPLVKPDIWQAFYRTAVEGEASCNVAAEMGITLNAVYIARSKVLSLIRTMGNTIITFNDDDDESSQV